MVMDVLDALRTRRTIHDFGPDPIDRDELAHLLEHAVWGPNHKLTEPWTFHAVTGPVKQRLAEIRRQLKLAKFDDPNSPQAQKSGDRAYREMATVPWVLVVTSEQTGSSIRIQEDYAATVCAIYGFQLAAWSRGIGTFWHTGPMIDEPEVYRLLDIPAEQRIAGIVLVGRAAAAPATRRTPAAEKTRWFGA